MGATLNGRAAEVLQQLLATMKTQNFAGYDPFDGLNSPVLKALGISRIRPLARAVQQAVKRIPLNMRPLLFVPRQHNPKGLALCLSAICKLNYPEAEEDARTLVDLLSRYKSPGHVEACWGYNFQWESRLFSLPRFSPNAVCTSFATNALLDAYQRFGFADAAEMARGAARFLSSRLNVTENEHGSCFSYTLLDRSITHNVNLLVTECLYRAATALNEPELSEGLGEHLRFAFNYQHANGAWLYGEDKGNAWVDGIHQAFNIISLERISTLKKERDEQLESIINAALNYYLDHLFEDGKPKYMDSSLYPIDTHAAATGIIALHVSRHRSQQAAETLERLLEFVLEELWLPKKKHFAYQKTRWRLIRTPFMRWVQSWMLLALATVTSEHM